jgi:hypothetical protein
MVSVMEAASRRILGFTLLEHHDAAAAYGALAMAVTVRGGRVPGGDHAHRSGQRIYRLRCSRNSSARPFQYCAASGV